MTALIFTIFVVIVLCNGIVAGMTCASPTQSTPLNLSLPRALVKQEPKPLLPGKDHEYNRKELLLQQLSDQKSPPILIPGAVPIHHKVQSAPSAYIVPQVGSSICSQSKQAHSSLSQCYYSRCYYYVNLS